MSRQTILQIASKENGNKESPANSNRTKYGAWYGLNGQKWCAIFVSWVYDHAGNPLGFIESANGYQSCQGGYNFWKAAGQLTANPNPGDIVLFDWDGDGHCDHTGIFEAWKDASKTVFFSWEGNTSVGNNSDGGMVMRRERNRSVVRAFASPHVLDNPSTELVGDNLEKGDINSQVALLQKMLHDLNYDIMVDGVFGDETVTIIKQFQQENHLETTGVVTPALWDAIEEKVNEPPVPAKKLTTGSFLNKGNSGSAVIELQNALNAAGADPAIKVDGVYAASTTNAVKLFQQKEGIQADGIAGPQTLAALGINNV
jgi:peptidoglycan hydrolase-like protein with peptidoglycan-binding domain